MTIVQHFAAARSNEPSSKCFSETHESHWEKCKASGRLQGVEHSVKRVE